MRPLSVKHFSRLLSSECWTATQLQCHRPQSCTAVSEWSCAQEVHSTWKRKQRKRGIHSLKILIISCMWVWVQQYLVTGTAEMKLYTRQCFDRDERRSAQTLGMCDGRQQRNSTSAHAASLRLSKKHSTSACTNPTQTQKQQDTKYINITLSMCQEASSRLINSSSSWMTTLTYIITCNWSWSINLSTLMYKHVT